jgi:UDP-N-acetylglucosamine--N-acetylmuramyl-(pentapeptide) pyrophosphoryl-undecaprenol N-acetylglucosamine transferase
VSRVTRVPREPGSSTSPVGVARVAFACGGTAGDILPAITVAESMPPEVDVVLVGDPAPFGERLATGRGRRFLATPAAPFARASWPGKTRSLAATARGTIVARRLLRREAIRLVMGFGGYASIPAVLAARSLGIPVVLFEANAVPGTATRVLDRFALRVLLGFATAAPAFRCPTTVTGVPLRPDILAVSARGPQTPLRVLVSGGSFGSRFLDEHAARLLARVVARGQPVAVRHIGDMARAQTAYAAAGIPATVIAYVDDMAAEYAHADVAIVSAGATTLAELAAVGLPAIVIPLGTAARDHQTPNARAFAAITGSMWCSERGWDVERLATHVSMLAASPATWGEAAAGMRRHARPDAARAVVRACLDALSLPGRASGSRAI